MGSNGAGEMLNGGEMDSEQDVRFRTSWIKLVPEGLPTPEGRKEATEGPRRSIGGDVTGPCCRVRTVEDSDVGWVGGRAGGGRAMYRPRPHRGHHVDGMSDELFAAGGARRSNRGKAGVRHDGADTRLQEEGQEDSADPAGKPP